MTQPTKSRPEFPRDKTETAKSPETRHEGVAETRQPFAEKAAPRPASEEDDFEAMINDLPV